MRETMPQSRLATPSTPCRNHRAAVKSTISGSNHGRRVKHQKSWELTHSRVQEQQRAEVDVREETNRKSKGTHIFHGEQRGQARAAQFAHRYFTSSGVAALVDLHAPLAHALLHSMCTCGEGAVCGQARACMHRYVDALPQGLHKEVSVTRTETEPACLRKAYWLQLFLSWWTPEMCLH